MGLDGCGLVADRGMVVFVVSSKRAAKHENYRVIAAASGLPNRRQWVESCLSLGDRVSRRDQKRLVNIPQSAKQRVARGRLSEAGHSGHEGVGGRKRGSGRLAGGCTGKIGDVRAAMAVAGQHEVGGRVGP